MEEVKKDLIQKMGTEFSDNISMATSTKEKDTCLADEAQSVRSTEEMDIETFPQQFKNQIEESSGSDKLKESNEEKSEEMTGH